MGTKSIIDVEINDKEFGEFKKKFDDYTKAVADSRKEWQKTTGVAKVVAGASNEITAAIAAQTALLLKSSKEQERAAKSSRDTEKSWKSISGYAKGTASSIASATTSLIKWAGIGSILSGLLGVGSIFGLDRLAAGVAGTRRASLGVGVSAGESKAFGLNFGRFVSDSFLSSVAEAQGDVTRRAGFYGAGLGEGDLGGSPADVSVKLLRSLKKIADQTDPRFYSQVIAARQLQQFISPDDLRRLRGTSSEEIESQIEKYQRDRQKLDVEPDAQRKWTDFYTQLSRAGEQIENTFVKVLTPIAPGFVKLSEGIEKFIETIGNSDTLKKWIEDVGGAIERLAKYIATPEFDRNVRSFVSGIAGMAEIMGRFIKLFGSETDKEISKKSEWDTNPLTGRPPRDEGDRKLNGWMRYLLGQRVGGVAGDRPLNNPGNLRPPGQSSGFMQYPTEEAGIKAMARQLGLYYRRDKIDTISGIVSKYAPSSENDTKAYIDAVSRRTGYGANEKLDLDNADVLSRIMSAMTKQENHKSNYTPSGIKVIIENNTGGNSIATTNQLAGQN